MWPTKRLADFQGEYGPEMGAWLWRRKQAARGSSKAFNANLPWNNQRARLRSYGAAVVPTVPTGPELRALFIRDKAWAHECPTLTLIDPIHGAWTLSNIRWIAGARGGHGRWQKHTVFLPLDVSPNQALNHSKIK
jgi:hypothetical protein